MAGEAMRAKAWRDKRTSPWTSTVFVVIAVFFPQVMANAAASLMTR
jgi:hypothetical protein